MQSANGATPEFAGSRHYIKFIFALTHTYFELPSMETCACIPAGPSRRSAGASPMALHPVDHDPGGLPGGQGPAAQALSCAGGDGLVRHHDGLSHSASFV